jgi:tRNA(Ile)-lysidine synthase
MDFLARLAATLREHELVTHGQTLVIGVSGGPDSLALLHALRALTPVFELQLHVAHLNHQLRGDDSDRDETFVLETARAWGLPAASARWDVRAYADEQRLSLEEAGRALRYQFLLRAAEGVGAGAIAVAHNADDQVETVLLHFLRGAGLAGLRGMAYRTRIANGQNAFDLIRPLLDLSRGEIQEYCAAQDLAPRLDESNFDTSLLRNRLRHNVIPYLETINPNFRQAVRHSALSIADDYAYIQQNVEGIFDRISRAVDSTLVFDLKWFRALPVNLQRGVLREAVTRLGQVKNVGFSHIERARRIAVEKEAGAQATFPHGVVLTIGYDEFSLGAGQPLPDAPLLLNRQPISLNAGDEILLPDSDWGVRAMSLAEPSAHSPEEKGSTWALDLDADKIQGQLVLRTRRRGDRFAPLGMGGKHQSLHEYMIDQKIPRHLRDLIPLLSDDEGILWVCGYRADERPQVTGATTNVLRVEFFKA